MGCCWDKIGETIAYRICISLVKQRLEATETQTMSLAAIVVDVVGVGQDVRFGATIKVG